MKNIVINSKKSVIEISKSFEKKASIVGSAEYEMLQKARRDYPTFTVATKRAAKKAKDNYRGLTYSYMEKYIKAHDDENDSIMKDYKELRALTDEAKEMMAEPLTYGEMKAWFFETFPEIEEFHAKREAILKRVEAGRAKKKTAKTESAA